MTESAKPPRVFGKPMRCEPYRNGSDVLVYRMRIGPIDLMLDPYVLGSAPFLSPTWDALIDGESVLVNRSAKVCAAAIEKRLSAIADAITAAREAAKERT